MPWEWCSTGRHRDSLAPGQPATVLKQGFDTYRNRHTFSSSGMFTFLETESSAFMISQGDPSDFALKWCLDSGANHSISNCLVDFTSDYREVNIHITVFQQNITTQAIGIGDCVIHTVYNMVQPYKIEIKDAPNVPADSLVQDEILFPAVALRCKAARIPSGPSQSECYFSSWTVLPACRMQTIERRFCSGSPLYSFQIPVIFFSNGEWLKLYLHSHRYWNVDASHSRQSVHFIFLEAGKITLGYLVRQQQMRQRPHFLEQIFLVIMFG